MTTSRKVIECLVFRVLTASNREVSEELSSGTTINEIPIPTGRHDSDCEVVWEGSLTAVITV